MGRKDHAGHVDVGPQDIKDYVRVGTIVTCYAYPAAAPERNVARAPVY